METYISFMSLAEYEELVDWTSFVMKMGASAILGEPVSIMIMAG